MMQARLVIVVETPTGLWEGPLVLVEQPHASHTGQQHKQAPEALCPWVSLRVLKEGFLKG